VYDVGYFLSYFYWESDFLSNSHKKLSLKKQGITILVYTTSACNLNCGYCYSEKSKKPKHITFETFKTCISKIDDFFGPNYEFSIIFHGGEPLLLGEEFFKQAFHFLKEGLKHKYCTGIQTNLTLINQGFINLFEENYCGVGTSLDGNQIMHNYYRKYSNGKGTYTCFMEKFRMVKKSKIECGVVSVIHDQNAVDPTQFYAFLKEYNETRFRFSPMFAIKDGKPYAINSEILGDFFINLYDLWISDEHPPKIIFFEDIIKSFLKGNRSSVCTFLRDCTKIFYTLDAEGNIYPCCHFVNRQEFCYGNLLNSSFSEIINSQVHSRVSKRGNYTKKLCSECEFYRMCFSGCMADTANGIYDKDYHCQSYQRIFRHIRKSLDEVLNNGK
jgi:uncharacterized protein